jgi:hypothetical protein
MVTILEVITQAIKANQEISIVYNGGSRPGQERHVTPLSLNGDNLIVFEFGSYVRKTYKLQKIASIAAPDHAVIKNDNAIQPEISDIPYLSSLQEYIEHFKKELVDYGWYLRESESSFSVASYFKNGKPRKSETIIIRYYDPSMQTIFDYQTGEMTTAKKELTGRERPWSVVDYRLNENGRTFGLLKNAFLFFMERARTHVP